MDQQNRGVKSGPTGYGRAGMQHLPAPQEGPNLHLKLVKTKNKSERGGDVG